MTADHGQLLGERVYPVPIREFAHPAGRCDEQTVDRALDGAPSRFDGFKCHIGFSQGETGYACFTDP